MIDDVWTSKNTCFQGFVPYFSFLVVLANIVSDVFGRLRCRINSISGITPTRLAEMIDTTVNWVDLIRYHMHISPELG
jgi:hypothetical protein